MHVFSVSCNGHVVIEFNVKRLMLTSKPGLKGSAVGALLCVMHSLLRVRPWTDVAADRLRSPFGVQM